MQAPARARSATGSPLEDSTSRARMLRTRLSRSCASGSQEPWRVRTRRHFPSGTPPSMRSYSRRCWSTSRTTARHWSRQRACCGEWNPRRSQCHAIRRGSRGAIGGPGTFAGIRVSNSRAGFGQPDSRSSPASLGDSRSRRSTTGPSSSGSSPARTGPTPGQARAGKGLLSALLRIDRLFVGHERGALGYILVARQGGAKGADNG